MCSGARHWEYTEAAGSAVVLNMRGSNPVEVRWRARFRRGASRNTRHVASLALTLLCCLATTLSPVASTAQAQQASGGTPLTAAALDNAIYRPLNAGTYPPTVKLVNGMARG